MRRLLVLSLAALLSSAGLAADLSPREAQILETVNASIRQAVAEYAKGNYSASAEGIQRAIEQIDTGINGATPQLYDSLQPSIRRIRTEHVKLQLEGIVLPPFREPQRPVAPSENAPSENDSAEAADGKSMPSEPDRPGVSFTEDVAPILVQRCGQCHIDASKGRFAIESYAALMRGTPAGAVVFAGDVTDSRLIATIESGDMPRGGGDVPPEELKTLKDWIASGAKFDGANPQAALTESSEGTPQSAEGPAPIRPATGDETVSFAADVAPILVENCKGCHLDAMQTRGGLRLDTFAQMMRGGDSGPLIVPGDANESLLVKKLRGSVGNRMPAGGLPPLSEESIQLVSTWIDEGATLDGAGRDQPIRVMSQLAWAEQATNEQMSERRRELAQEHLALVTGASGKTATAETEHFQLAGTASQQTIDLVARLAEDSMDQVRKDVPGDAGDGYFSGRATIFVMPRRYDYSELAKMIEQRSVPSDWMSHWKFDGIDAYVAMVAGEDDDKETLENRLFGPLVSLAVKTRGENVPRWFAEGVGVTIAAREGANRNRQSRRQRHRETIEAIAAMDSAKAFLENRLTPEQTDRIGAALAASMLDRTRRRAFDQLLRLLGDDVPFDDAFAQSFGGPPEDYVNLWLKWVRGRTGG